MRMTRRDFNPRARVGRDTARQISEEALPIFQSTRPRGARREKVEGFGVRISISIHAPAWGATCRRTATASSKPFQSTRPRGARRAS